MESEVFIAFTQLSRTTLTTLLPGNSPHPELWPGLLQGLGGGVQSAPPVGQLCLPPLPALQKQRRPHNVEEGKHHTADILTGLCKGHTTINDSYLIELSVVSQKAKVCAIIKLTSLFVYCCILFKIVFNV